MFNWTLKEETHCSRRAGPCCEHSRPKVSKCHQETLPQSFLWFFKVSMQTSILEPAVLKIGWFPSAVAVLSCDISTPDPPRVFHQLYGSWPSSHPDLNTSEMQCQRQGDQRRWNWGFRCLQSGSMNIYIYIYICVYIYICIQYKMLQYIKIST